MPLGKYNCDYCEKQFQDTPSARKRHLQGLQHLRAKAQWYHSQNANDPNHSLTEPFAKGICNRFVKTVNIPLFSKLFWVYFINSIGFVSSFSFFKGFCQFGDNCKYFHPKNDSRGANPQAAAAPAPGPTALVLVSMLKTSRNYNSQDPPPDKWERSVEGAGIGMSWGNLPPSLKPPPEGGYPPLPFVDWG
ncbi:hypothetical protein QUC31_009324 [Theobroma cacao]|nr:U1-C [Theobroma cacao]